MNRKLTTLAAMSLATMTGFALLPSGVANAAESTQTFGVSATVQNDCVIKSAGSMAFGTIGALNADVDGSSTIKVKCTNTTVYNIGLSAGTTIGATVADRKMIGESTSPATLNYALYSDSGRSKNWGNTVGTDTVTATGTGADVDHTVYGRIPIQTAPKPDGYSDLITVTVTY